MLTTLQLINHIVSNPHYTTIAIDGCDDKTPKQAIELLSSESFANIWSINGSLEKNTLLVYDRSNAVCRLGYMLCKCKSRSYEDFLKKGCKNFC
jgi:peptidase E